jgi:dTDP-4-amino-4,6-dideoxygalactose transaminase
LKKRKTISDNYKKLILRSNLEEHVKIPTYNSTNRPSYHLFLALINFTKLKCNKDYLFNFFKKKNIYLQYHYIPLYKFSFYKNKNLNFFKNTNKYYKNAISLPIYYDLSFNQQRFVVDILKKIIDKKKK